MNVIMNDKKVSDHIKGNDGFCIECGNIQYGGIEPDAVACKCEECGENRVVGFETAVLYEWIIISKSKTPILDQYKKGEIKMTMFKVAYDPDITQESRIEIADCVVPSMVSESEPEAQYEIEASLEHITNLEDQQKLKEMIADDVSYLEF